MSGVVESAAFAGHRVLLVDDNVDLANSIAALLELWGHSPQIALSGADALKAVAAFAPRVIILDIGLPQMDGFEVLRRLREGGHLDRVYTIALTGYGNDNDKSAIREAGFDTHLIKPVQPAVLKQLLADI